MKDIVAKSEGEAKLRLRGKGSGYLERDSKKEAPDPLQLCISSPRRESYTIAKRCAEALVRQIYAEYDKWCIDHSKEERAPLNLRVTERNTASKNDDRDGDETAKPTQQKKRGVKGKVQKKALPAPVGLQIATASSAVAETDSIRPDGAPSVEEIKRLIDERNNCRKDGEYARADKIRDDLKDRGVVLSDEKGAHGHGLSVTTFRYWSERSKQEGSNQSS